RRGATDYLQKPFTPEQVLLVVARVADMRRMEQRIAILQEDIERSNPAGFFNSNHPEMQRTIETARQVAASEAVVMLLGPSGTGKTVLAKAIHDWSRRAGKPFGVISCPSLSSQLLESELFGHVKGAFTGAVRDNPGRIAACENGTIFLDEIGAIPISIQPKLLRFIQEREYERVGDHQTRRANVRIISATNENLEQAVKDGRFREDLYYRLNVIEIKIPPLCERPEDIENIASNMLAFFGAQNHKKIAGFSVKAIAAMKNYGWPGNIRELRNVIERAAILCQGEYIGTEHLPEAMAPRTEATELGANVSLEKIEEAHIRRIIATTKSLHDAAEILGIDQATLWRKRKHYGI
ncbi:MAG: sigma-54 interaction domain-containing protein, partial [Victivallaceae bacterium]